MSRADYHEDLDDLELGRWRGQVESAIRGRRGQRFFVDLVAALDAMPEKSLVRNELLTEDGEVCAMGALGVARGIDMSKMDPDDPDVVAAAFDIAPQLARETAYVNDDSFDVKRPEERWVKMRAWAVSKIRKNTEPAQ